MGSVIMRIIQCSIVMSILWSVALGQPDILIQDSFDSFHEEWDVHDPDSKITLDFTIDERLEFENWIRYDEGYVLQMITPISDFTFDYTFQISAVGGNGKSVGPCISDSQGSLTDMASGNGIYLLYSGYNGSGIAIYTVENGSLVYDVGTGSNKINVSVGTTYFVGFEKSGDQLNLSVYTDSERTSHLAGSPVSITSNFGDTEFNSFHAINSWVSPVEGNWEWSTGWIDDITLKTDNSETIAYWDAENISGTDVPDESGNGHNGTLVNGAVQTTSGLVGNGIYLDGIDDYVEIPATGDLNSTSTQFTAEAWIYPNNLNHNGWIMGRNGNWFMLIHDDGTINYATNYNEQWNIPANVQINEWQHVALTYDGTEMKFYFNGQLLHSTPYSEPVMQHGDPVVIGLDAINPSNFFHGVVDDVRLSNVALEPHEFLNSGIFQETETLAHWTFDEGEGTEVYDQSGNGHTGTLHNGASWTNGYNGGGVSFDGTDDYINLNSDLLWNLPSGTIEVILKADVIDSDNWLFAYAMDTGHGISMCIDQSYALCYQFGPGLPRGAGNSIVESQWYHIALTWDGTTAKSYINGVLDIVEDNTAMPIEEVHDLIFGADSYFRPEYSFDGTIDEIRISGEALSPSDFLEFVPLNQGTIAYWDAENISGTDVPDESGNGHNGTLVNGAVQTTSGLVGNGIYLDGIDDYVEIPATGDLNSTSTQFTAEAWIYPNNLNHNGWIMGRNGNWFMLIHDDGTINYATNYNEQWNIPANVQINEWQHVALTYDGTEMKFYFNGQLLHSTPYSEPVMQHGDPVVIGLDAINPSNFFHGVVDDVRLSNVALEPHEFLNSGIFQETETLAHWTFDEGSGSEVYDQTGNGHTGTLHNGASWTAGINSGALDFDGVDDYVNVPSNFLWGLQSGTIEVILNPDVIDSDNWFFAYAMDTHHGVSMCVDNSRSACVQFNGGGGEVYRGSPDQVFENEWVHLAVSWDGNVVNSYINGVVDYETSDSGIPTEEPQALIFGADSYFRETYSFDGKIDEIRISSGILQPEQFLRFESLLNTAIVSTPTQYTQPGQTLAVPIQIALPNEVGVSAIELSFSGFDQWLQFESVSLEGTLAGAYGWSAESNLQGNSINLALYGANAFIGEGILCNLNFTCLDVGASQFALEFLNGLIDTGELDIHFDSGTIFINSPNYGDVDLNGHIQAFDASMIMKHLSGIVTLNEQQLLNSDVSGIEGITAYDAALVAKYVVGLIDDFPVMNGSGSLNAAGELSIADIDVTDPLYFDVPFNFNDLSNVTSLELSMDYPSDKLDYQGIVWPESLLPFMKEINISNGHISLVAAHSSQLLSGNIEVRLQFGISSSFEAGEVVYFTSDQFKLNENINIIEPIRGSIYNTVGLDDQFVGIPTEFSVMPNIPNPFNPSTTIRYGLPEEANISLVVYDIRGNLVQTLKSDHQSSGWYDVVWNGQTADGKTTSTGIYFARLVASDYSQVIKMLYLK